MDVENNSGRWGGSAMAAMACLRLYCRTSCIPVALFLSTTHTQKHWTKTNKECDKRVPVWLRSDLHSHFLLNLTVRTMTQSPDQGTRCRRITFSLGEVSLISLTIPFPNMGDLKPPTHPQKRPRSENFSLNIFYSHPDERLKPAGQTSGSFVEESNLGFILLS